MEETQKILRQMGFENPNDNVWKSEWFGYFILAKEATPQQLALFIYDRGYNKGTKDTLNTETKSVVQQVAEAFNTIR
jgi:hypothetical protein